MNTPTTTIHGPSDEMPSTGRAGSSGTDVSIIEMENATTISNTRPRATIVDGSATR